MSWIGLGAEAGFSAESTESELGDGAHVDGHHPQALGRLDEALNKLNVHKNAILLSLIINAEVGRALVHQLRLRPGHRTVPARCLTRLTRTLARRTGISASLMSKRRCTPKPPPPFRGWRPGLLSRPSVTCMGVRGPTADARQALAGHLATRRYVSPLTIWRSRHLGLGDRRRSNGWPRRWRNDPPGNLGRIPTLASLRSTATSSTTSRGIASDRLALGRSQGRRHYTCSSLPSPTSVAASTSTNTTFTKFSVSS